MALERNDSGETLFAWSGEDPSGLDVTYRSKGHQTWSHQDAVVPDGSGPTCYASPTAALADNGSAVITWENYRSDPDRFDATELLARRATASR